MELIIKKIDEWLKTKPTSTPVEITNLLLEITDIRTLVRYSFDELSGWDASEGSFNNIASNRLWDLIMEEYEGEKTEDIELLELIAAKTKDSVKKHLAIERVNALRRIAEIGDDQMLLADTAKNAEDYDERILAVKKITDQNLLADLAENAEDLDVQEIAAERLEELN